MKVGLFGQDFSAASREVIAREADVIVNHGFSWNVMEPTPEGYAFGPADVVDTFATELFGIVREAAPAGTELFVNENFVEYFPVNAAG